MNKNNNKVTRLREPTLNEPVVKVGSTVSLLAEITRFNFEPEVWKLLVIDFRDISEYVGSGVDYCTSNSPLGLLILGKPIGFSGEYKTDNGFPYRVTILDIENPGK